LDTENGFASLSDVQGRLGGLHQQATLAFDPQAHRLRETFAALLFADWSDAADLTDATTAATRADARHPPATSAGFAPLEQLHQRASSDKGMRKDRKEKERLLAPLLDPERRRAFHQVRGTRATPPPTSPAHPLSQHAFSHRRVPFLPCPVPPARPQRRSTRWCCL
jgi:hypothetical protein